MRSRAVRTSNARSALVCVVSCLILAVVLRWGSAPAPTGHAGSRAVAAALAEGNHERERAVLANTRVVAKAARGALQERFAVGLLESPSLLRVRLRATIAEPMRDGRRQVQRIRARRKVPRMNSEEPPWA